MKRLSRAFSDFGDLQATSSAAMPTVTFVPDLQKVPIQSPRMVKIVERFTATTS
ncbi:MAG TPA: hypothetical protein VKH81_17870 [Candidatus Angelobacter sp.]|nr:hypothetical protein [Candidatus Angelobacter sp.]